MMNMNQQIGKYFGYPKCCIRAYQHILDNAGRKTAEQSFVASNGFGFIPCPRHAKLIVDKVITIESLIKKRKCPLPFPEEPEMEVLDQYLSKLAI